MAAALSISEAGSLYSSSECSLCILLPDYHSLLLASARFLLPLGLDITVVETVLILRSSFFHSRFGCSLCLTWNRAAKAIVHTPRKKHKHDKNCGLFFLYRDEANSLLSIFMLVLKTLSSQSEWISLPRKGRIIRMGLLYRNAVRHIRSPFLSRPHRQQGWKF